MMGSYEELLKEKGFVLKYTRGISMEPMLREGREQSLIRSVQAMGREPRQWDVVLFSRGREYVLHRIVGRKGELFRIRGDNCMGSDLVKREEILGILAGFYRGETYIDCQEDKAYLRYVRMRWLTYPLRWVRYRVVLTGRALIRRVFRPSARE